MDCVIFFGQEASTEPMKPGGRQAIIVKNQGKGVEKMKSVKYATAMALALAGCTLLAGPALAAEEEKPFADLTVGAYSQYIWRGFALSKDSIVVQPSMTIGYKGFSMNLWGNLDSDPYSSTTDNKNNWTETDLTLAYDREIGPVALTAGYIYYALDAANDTQEVFVSASYDTFLSPTLSVYKDIANFSGWYATLGISHSLPLTETLALDLGAQVGYLRANEASSYEEVDGSGTGTGKAYRAMHDGLLSAALPIALNQYLTITPELKYSFAMSSKASDLLENSNQGVINDREDNFIYGGVSMTLAF